MKHERIPGPGDDPAHDPIKTLARKTVADYLKLIERRGLCQVCAIGELASYGVATHFVSMDCCEPNEAGEATPVPERVAEVAEFLVNDALGMLQEFLEHRKEQRL